MGVSLNLGTGWCSVTSNAHGRKLHGDRAFANMCGACTMSACQYVWCMHGCPLASRHEADMPHQGFGKSPSLPTHPPTHHSAFEFLPSLSFSAFSLFLFSYYRHNDSTDTHKKRLLMHLLPHTRFPLTNQKTSANRYFTAIFAHKTKKKQPLQKKNKHPDTLTSIAYQVE